MTAPETDAPETDAPPLPDTLAGGAEAVLRTRDPWRKAALSRRLAQSWLEGRGLGEADARTQSVSPDGFDAPRRTEAPFPIGRADPPETPARPEHPALLEPREMPKRRPGSKKGRAALLHAIAHIELNAIDLHWDIVARFTSERLPLGFYDDWALAAAQEAKHFQLLTARLEAMDVRYGDLPAHAGMWRSATATQHDLMARLAVVPMVLEARGLDVTPGMIDIFRDADDADAVAALEVIYAEEVGHVAYGSKWFHFLCGRADIDPKSAFHTLVRTYFGGAMRPPFNDEKRAEAGLPHDFYWPLANEKGAPTGKAAARPDAS